MPCRSDGYEQAEWDRLRAELDTVTDMLCRMIRAVPASDRLLPGDIEQWWSHHKRADKIREAKEKIAEGEAVLKAMGVKR